MNKEDFVEVLTLAGWFLLFYSLGYYVGRRHERLVYDLIKFYKAKEKSKDESVPLSNE